MSEITEDSNGISQETHNRGVMSRTHKTCLVIDPITIILDGHRTELSLKDAAELLKGLQAAVVKVGANSKHLFGDCTNYNVVGIGKVGGGMSCDRSKLGNGNARRINGNLEYF